MLIETLSTKFRRALTANSTDTSFASKVATLTEPSGSGVLDMGAGGALAPNGVLVVPYGAGNDDTTFAMRIIGWRSITEHSSNQKITEWIPIILVELACTLSTAVGATGGVIGGGRMADTLSLVTGNDDISIDFVSPTGNVAAHAVVDVKGCEKIEFSFDMTGATSGNCLVATL